MNYQEFLAAKVPSKRLKGFKPLWMPKEAFDFQQDLSAWNIQMGVSATFAQCGLGKSLMELIFGENVCRHTKGNALLLAPLTVVPQMIDEAKKFGIKAKRTRQGEVYKGINVTNYHRLQYYKPEDFTCLILDEGSILKNFEGKYRKLITQFISKIPYRLIATATPAPNDYMELGTISEALGVMGRNQMLGMFFTNGGETTQQWELKGHARKAFWRWVASWARAVRKPSDLGYDDTKFILPKLNVNIHTVKSKAKDGLFAKVASTLSEQRKEKKETMRSRCEKAASVLPDKRSVIAWAQLNSEADLLTKLIPDAVQIKGGDDDEYKEETLQAFAKGQLRAIVTKPSIASLGLNLQVCHDLSCFPDHSHERYYQLVRRCWRFGQKHEVNCHIVTSEAEQNVLRNMLAKERSSDEMYNGIVREMANAESKDKTYELNGHSDIEVPSWL